MFSLFFSSYLVILNEILILILTDKSKACASLRLTMVMAVQRAQADAICDRGFRTGMCRV